MRLEAIQLRLRRRNGWEALDLGLVMLRAWARPAYAAWCATYVPFAFVMWVVSAIWEPLALWSMLLVWWLKPVFDRVLLHVYGRALFGEHIGIRQVWRDMPGILRNSGLLWGLTFGRLSVARSFRLPIWQLEGSRGAQARERARVLGSTANGFAIWITVFCSHLSVFIFISLVILTAVLVPSEIFKLVEWEDFAAGQIGPMQDFVLSMLGIVAESIVEPVFVACGFALYLSRRTELEGWDIELGLRRLAERRAEQLRSGTLSAALSAVAVGLALFVGTPAEVRAESRPGAVIETPAEPGSQPKQPAAAKSEPKRAIEEVLADPEFGREVKEKVWKWRKTPDEESKPKDKTPDEPPDWLKPFANLMQLLAQAGRAVIWAAAVLLLAIAIWLAWRYRDAWGLRDPARRKPDFLFGLDVRPDSLPDDVAAAARRALAEGRVAEALSLLYRGALVTLIHRDQVEFRAGDTEGDCLRRVTGKINANAYGYFSRLLLTWQLVAYAHREQPADQLGALCDEWPAHFAAATPEPAA